MLQLNITFFVARNPKRLHKNRQKSPKNDAHTWEIHTSHWATQQLIYEPTITLPPKKVPISTAPPIHIPTSPNLHPSARPQNFPPPKQYPVVSHA